MSEIKEQIVERLREEAAYRAESYAAEEYIPMQAFWRRQSDICAEAADRIESLETSREAARQNFLTMQGTAATLAGRIKVLEEALRPFARAAQSYDPDEDDGDMDAWDYRPTIGELRFARLALNATPQDGKGGEEWDS